SRSTLEMQDRSCRPAIAGRVEDMAAYDVVFVGFPIWWYREPSIIDTFMEAYDFAGKSVVPFATSGGSGMADSGANMAALAPGAKVDEGRRFTSLARNAELAAWASTWLS
ncbi:MAG: flavodoxin, partial [Eggerthellaceae bacterium]|nr:flavodoxin [Eggerthellaceae bacterium]